MPGRMMKDDSSGPVPLVTSREPKGPKLPGGPGTTGDEAFKDAIFLVVIAWAVLFFLSFSLSAHSV